MGDDQFQVLAEKEIEDNNRFDESEKLCGKANRKHPVAALDGAFVEVRVFFGIIIYLLHTIQKSIRLHKLYPSKLLKVK